MIDRYAREEMKSLWSLENKFNKWLDIEIYACEAWAQLGFIPEEAVAKIKEQASFSVERIKEIEEETRHDVMAFTRCVSETLGEEARFIHYGLTSSDVVDTALSAQLQEAAAIIDKGLEDLGERLKEKALYYKHTAIMGRTHGVHAEPSSLGLKFALWWSELQRNLQRWRTAKEGCRYGKLSGAVGNFAHIHPFVEEYVCEKMGLKAAPISTQVLSRDLHAELTFSMSLIAACLEKIALEFRHLQRTEVRELEEPFLSGQKGSSAMPHKRNPVMSERITGLSRVLRSKVTAALENVPLWHERDISHSSVERINLPDAAILTDYLIQQIIIIISDFQVYPENMLKNIHKTGGLVFSQRVLLKLVEKGFSRENAYDTIQKIALRAWESGESFQELVINDSELNRLIGEDPLQDCFDPAYYLNQVEVIYRRLGI